MTPEGAVKNKVKKFLTPLKPSVYFHMPVQNGMGSPTLDFVGCVRGRYFAIETKAGDSKPTARQELTATDISAAGGVAFLIDANELSLEVFKTWVREVLNDSAQADEIVSAYRRGPTSAFVYPTCETLVIPGS